MVILEDSTPLAVSSSDGHASTDDNVFVTDSSNNVSSPISSPATPISGEVPGVPEGNPLKGMERFILI